jgi:hypothetical protein
MEAADFPVNQLPDRYSISRSGLYEIRIPALEKAGLGKPYPKGNKSFITPEQLKFLDALDIALKNGEDVITFLEKRGVAARQSTEQSGLATIEPQTAALMSVMAQFLPTPDPLEHIRLLDEACEKGWKLSTSELCILLKVKRIPGQQIQRYGFVCDRVGRNGAESAWVISRE